MADLEQDGSSRSSSRGSSFSLCHMTESAYAKVIFCELHDSYSADSDIECLYQLSESVVPHPDDYIGLFRVGWQNLDECIASVPCASASLNASLAGDNYNKIIFNVKDLPKDDLEYYQFLYLTGDHEICGASTPFKFHTIHEDENVVVLSTEHDFLEVKSSASLLHHQLAATQKYVTSLEKAKKELEDRVLKAETENHETQVKLEKINLEQEEFENQLGTYLSCLARQHKILPALPKCSETLEVLIFSVKALIDRLSKDNVYLIEKAIAQERDTSELKVGFESDRAEALAMQSSIAKHLKSSVQHLMKENVLLMEEKRSLQAVVHDTRDLFRASEECKSLVLQELENVKKSKDEMSASMEDLKLLNSLLKKQLANNENAIKEMEKVWRELEEVKINFDSEKESWDKQRSELEEQVRDLKVRLKDAAELYKKQFLEIRSLKKHLRSCESSRRKLSNDGAVGISSDRVRCSSSDHVPSSLEGTQTPSFMTESLISLSDCSCIEHTSTTEREQLDAVSNSRPASQNINYSACSSCSSADITVDKASAPAEEEMKSPKAETSAANLSAMASAALSKLIIREETVSSEVDYMRTETYTSPQATLQNDLKQKQDNCDSSVASSHAIDSSQISFEVFDIPCPLCDELITVCDKNTIPMDEHLFKVHNQQLCPVCGLTFDNGLPSNYFKYHVENHFTGTQSTQ